MKERKNEREKKMKNKKRMKTFLFVGIVFFLLLDYLLCINNVNAMFQVTSYERFQVGEPVVFEGIEMTYLEKQFLTAEEFLKKYPNQSSDFINLEKNNLFIFVKMNLTNKQNKVKQGLNRFTEFSIICGNNYGTDSDLYCTNSVNEKNVQMQKNELQPNASTEIIIVYIVNKKEFLKEKREDPREKQWRLVINLYPNKKVIEL